MRTKKLISFGVFVLILFLPCFAFPKSHYQYVHSPETDIYFGHISYTEVKHDGNDPVVLRAGVRQPEVAVLNFPLAPGDIIRTTEHRRCEIQFDTGTIIRLDVATELKIETVLAQSLSSLKKLTNLVLNKGQIYIMYKKYSYPEIFQVMTPTAGVKIKHGTVAIINAREDESTDVRVRLGKAYVIYGPDEQNIDEKKVKKLEKLTITKDHQALEGEYREDVDFALWNEHMNENFEDIHKGISPLPKPIYRYPRAVVYFAEKYSNIHGEWIWHDLYGYVWRPSYNDYYPWGGWQPYYYGHWTEINDHLFWVPEEKWGWVPYHLGLWIWSKKYGWIWMPGSAFAPSWSVWNLTMGYCYWRFWSLWDWYPSHFSWAYGAGVSGISGAGGAVQRTETISVISKKQLKKKGNTTYIMPKEIKRALNKVISALKKGDKRVIDSLRKIPDHMVIVRKQYLNVKRIQDRALKLRDIPSQARKELLSEKSSRNAYREAVDSYKMNAFRGSLRDYKNQIESYYRGYITSSLKKNKESISDKAGSLNTQKMPVGSKIKVSKPRIISPEKETSFHRVEKSISNISKSTNLGSSLRFRDWNPDVGLARKAGVSIKYISRTNEIRCPELRLSSRNVGSRGHVGRGGSFSSSGSGSSSGSAGSSSSSGSSSASSRSSGSSGSKSSGNSSRSGGSRSGSKKN
jgi:hypothetical protein